jgi:hypothetical protein
MQPTPIASMTAKTMNANKSAGADLAGGCQWVRTGFGHAVARRLEIVRRAQLFFIKAFCFFCEMGGGPG